MCLGKAYLKEESLILTTILRETREVEARLSRIDFQNGGIVLERSG